MWQKLNFERTVFSNNSIWSSGSISLIIGKAEDIPSGVRGGIARRTLVQTRSPSLPRSGSVGEYITVVGIEHLESRIYPHSISFGSRNCSTCNAELAVRAVSSFNNSNSVKSLSYLKQRLCLGRLL